METQGKNIELAVKILSYLVTDESGLLQLLEKKKNKSE